MEAMDQDECALTQLPAELIGKILEHLAPRDLNRVSATCRHLLAHATADHLWQRLAQAHVRGGARVASPRPCASFRALYRAHARHWFLADGALWFADGDLAGRLAVARFDPRRGCLEGYQLLATRARAPPGLGPNGLPSGWWQVAPDVFARPFRPDVRLHLDRPVLQLDALDGQQEVADRLRDPVLPVTRIALRPDAEADDDDGPGGAPGPPPPRARGARGARTPMAISNEHVAVNFIAARVLSPAEAAAHGDGRVWPPPTIPAPHRVARMPGLPHLGADTQARLLDDCDGPAREASDMAFRIGERLVGLPAEAELVTTYATLDRTLYTPTARKPWRGIWVGDYNGHGCEFLLMHQPDDEGEGEGEGEDEPEMQRLEDEPVEAWEARVRQRRLMCGRLEAIKLTGDPNVPRGEYSFVVDDLRAEAVLPWAADEPFTGATVVCSRGHIANDGFRDDRWVQTRLLLVSPDRMAHYWAPFRHVSFYERVDIDGFLTPS
ncbi:hypothetical protein P8C59_001568 [Phyllachora maydis]|uniref:F-box domain-containing protein n=1 Tax=Phyllachora maydis TaxID=1825666 RepID=A0AAD9MBJ1_9PEZI|nr:hypothetical protein P8C59_001568 [Phyllachora maydis]